MRGTFTVIVRAVLSLVAAGGLYLHAAAAPPNIAPPESWIVPQGFHRPSLSEESDPGNGIEQLLIDRQINALVDADFEHEVYKILSLDGVEHASRISVDYEPTYETLTFHWLRVWRGTNIVHELGAGQIRVIQQQSELDHNILNDEQTALVLLEDTRAGDIIDYAYTITGSNPILAGRFFDSVQIQTSRPAARFVTRLVWPGNRPLYIKNHGTEIKPVAARKGDALEYRWDIKNPPGVRIESQLPTWYEPLPWVQLSEFKSWEEVNHWATQLFTNPGRLDPDLAARIKEWRRMSAPEDRILAALRFVQDEVRYQGVEAGVSKYTPANPSAVYGRRFGDCKDKALLLTTILRALGLDAAPVLVNSTWRQTIADWQPTSTAFDHAIVAVKHDGETNWLDGTARYERGRLAKRYWPSYGCGLVVQPGTKTLAAIPECAAQPLTTVTEYIQLASDLKARSDFKVVTVAEGEDAVRLRAQHATTPGEEFRRQRLDEFARLYPDVQETQPLGYSDDEEQNRIEVIEHYSVGKMWKMQSDRSRYYCTFYSHNVDGAVHKPSVSFRTMPLAVRHPEHQVFRAEIQLQNWPYAPGDNRDIENGAFAYRKTTSMLGTTVELNFDYQTLADAVWPQEAHAYLEQLDQLFESLDYTLYSP